MGSKYTMTYSSLTGDLFGEPLTLSQADSLASHSVPPESEKERQTTGISGQKCLERLSMFSRVTSWQKTFSALLIGQGDWFSSRCRLTWSLRGTRFGRVWFLLQASERRTAGTVFGLLPSPVASDATTGAIIGKDDTFRQTLGFPRKVNRNGVDGSMGLARLVQLLSTLKAQDCRGESGKNVQGGMSLTDHIRQDGKTFQLNPLFAEEMMGYPIGWTELKPSETA
jgi:hypothetical protein